jgi:hypothetical protein
MFRKDVLVGSWELLDKMGLEGIVSVRNFVPSPSRSTFATG